MEFFKKSKAVRLRSVHGKYLYADQDEESVRKNRNGASEKARWTIEFVEGNDKVIRLKSCYGRYLTASDKPFPLTGGRVLQTLPARLDSSVEWQPVDETYAVKLKTRYGDFLRANNGLPPWRNTITHDIPNRTMTQDSVLWKIDVVQIQMGPSSPLPPSNRNGVLQRQTSTSDTSSYDGEWSEESEGSVSGGSRDFKSFQSRDKKNSPLSESQSPKCNGRFIYYAFGDEDIGMNDAIEWPSFVFMGSNLKELKRKVEEVTGLHDFVICSRNPVNGGLCPLRLHLPPNNSAMHIVLVNSSSTLAKNLPHRAGGRIVISCLLLLVYT